MEPYGHDFREYYVARKLFFEKERKKEIWLYLGVLTQLALVVAGALLLPATHLFIWAVTILIAGAILLSGLLSIWWKQRDYTSFDRWLKHREREKQSRDAAGVSRQCSGKCCPGRVSGRKRQKR